ncbi:MAG: tRNA adenosine(34) deaminase TadA [Clostridia bacterium]|nr:tRNA adenosine(34) deaminase TadA [Clostridia bacterium]
MEREKRFMKAAIKEAYKAREKDEVPIGAVIVLDGIIIARGHNETEKTQIATRHAEIIAIEKACKKLKSWRLDGAEIYITVEPCAMCAGAIANARIKRAVFGAYEHKSGCAESKYPVLGDNGLNHSVEYTGGVFGEECSKMLTEYFADKRKRAKVNASIK